MHFYFSQDRVNRLAAELLEEMCMKVARGCPRAAISWTFREEMRKEEIDVLDEVLAGLEPWSKEWLAWRDETDILE